jgi:hypothetical protein
VESLLGEAEVSSPATRLPVRTATTFDPTVGSPSKFYRSFRTPFSQELMRNRYSVTRRYRRPRPEYPFERAITFDSSVGPPSKFYRCFAVAVFLEVEVESLLGDAEVSSPKTRVPVRNGHNF